MLTTVTSFLVGLVHTAAWSMLVVAALRPRKIRVKEQEKQEEHIGCSQETQLCQCPFWTSC